MTDYWPHCLMCKVCARARDTPFRQLIGPDCQLDEVLAERDPWLSVLDVAPIVEGWSLIVHRPHISSLSEADPSSMNALIALKNSLSNAMYESYGVRPFFLEHGGFGEQRGGACIEHAHLHAVPFPGDIEQDLRRECDLSPIAGIWDLARQANREGYLYYERNDGKAFLANDPDVRHQLVRRLVARSLPENPPWEWREYLQNADDIGTRTRLTSALEKLGLSSRSHEKIPANWKLVRDGIPAIAGTAARRNFSFLEDPAELPAFLAQKLVEEAKEYQGSRKLEELADVLEVLLTLTELSGVDCSRLMSLAEEKRSTRGGFRAWWLMRLGNDR